MVKQGRYPRHSPKSKEKAIEVTGRNIIVGLTEGNREVHNQQQAMNIILSTSSKMQQVTSSQRVKGREIGV